MKHFVAVVLSSLIVVATTFGCANATDWNVPTPYSDKTFHTVNINKFADDIRTATNGDLNIVVHSAGSLIKHSEIKSAVRSRQVPMGEFFLSTLSNENAAFGLDSEPFLATNYKDAAKLWSVQKPVITELLAKQNILPLFAVPWPPQGLYTNGEIKSVADLNGLKFRAYNATLEKFAKLAGAAPTQVEAPDIPQAFSTSQIEAMITSPTTGVNTKAWDYVSHYSPINAWIPKNIVVVNKDAFDSLDAETQKIVMDAAASAEMRGWRMSQVETKTNTAALTTNGMIIVEPSAELISGLQDIGVQMQENWQEKVSDQAKAIYKAYEKIK